VKAFQAAHNCAVDGWAGDETKRALISALQQTST
jgi:peptidoglycan hydrolase-like protein with peptidoglycan-binding domain